MCLSILQWFVLFGLWLWSVVSWWVVVVVSCHLVGCCGGQFLLLLLLWGGQFVSLFGVGGGEVGCGYT